MKNWKKHKKTKKIIAFLLASAMLLAVLIEPSSIAAGIDNTSISLDENGNSEEIIIETDGNEIDSYEEAESENESENHQGIESENETDIYEEAESENEPENHQGIESENETDIYEEAESENEPENHEEIESKNETDIYEEAENENEQQQKDNSTNAGNILTYEDDTVVVTAVADADDAFHVGEALKVTPLSQENTDTAAQYESIDSSLWAEAEKYHCNLAGFLAYDLALLDENGNEMTLNNDVTVSLSFKMPMRPIGVEPETFGTNGYRITALEFEHGQLVDIADDNRMYDWSVDTEFQLQRTEFTVHQFAEYAFAWLEVKETEVQEEAETTEPTETPEATETPEPTEITKVAKSALTLFGAGKVAGGSSEAGTYAYSSIAKSIAEDYMPTGSITNEWQVVSGEYGTTNMQVTEDGLFRIQKNVIPTETENEFYVYLNIEPQMQWSWEEFISHASVWILNSNCNKDSITLPENPTPDEVKNASSGGQAAKLCETEEEANQNTTKPDACKHVAKIILKNTDETTAVEMDYDGYYSIPQNSTDSFTILLAAPGSDTYWKIGGVSYDNGVLTLPADAWTTITEKVIHKDDFVSMSPMALPTVVTDPMGEYIEYKQLVECTNGTANFDETTGTLTWSEFTAPETSGSADDFEIFDKDTDTERVYRKYAYQLIYKVRLMVEKEGFNSCAEYLNDDTKKDYPYQTNGTTILKYSYKTEETEETKDTEFTVPEVRGLLYDVEFQKTDEDGNALPGAVFLLGDETAVSGSDGYVKFRNLAYGTYQLEESQAPNGYIASVDTYSVRLCYTTDRDKLIQDHGTPHAGDLESDIKNMLYQSTNLTEKGEIINSKPGTPPSEDTPEDVPYRKYIDYLGDGGSNTETGLSGDEFYRLYLDVTGIPNTEPIPADIVLILDRSSSMNSTFKSGTRWAAVQSSARLAVNTFLGENSKNRISIVWFDKAAQIYGGLTNAFTNDKQSLLNEINNKTIGYGTNYHAAFMAAQDVLKTTERKKFVIFVTDGEPYGYTKGTDYTDERSYVGDVNSGKEKAKEQAAKLSNLSGFYTVAVREGDEFLSKDIINAVTGASVKQSFYADQESDLEAAFDVIVGSITKQIGDVTIRDTLSEYVTFSDEAGELFAKYDADGDGTITIDSSDSSLIQELGLKVQRHSKNDSIKNAVDYSGDYTWTIDLNNKTISVNFGKEYFLERDVVYTISFNVKLTEAAYMTSYDAKGDARTDYPGNVTSSGQDGLLSNSAASLTYSRVTDGKYEEETKMYPDPVVQAKVSHTVIKQWKGTTGAGVKVKLAAYVGSDSDRTEITNQILPADQQAEVLLNEGNNWTFRWINLPKKYYMQGSEAVDIFYTAKEISILQKPGQDSIYETEIMESENGLTTTIVNSEVSEWNILKKSSSDSSIKLQGAEFELKSDEDEALIYKGVSDADGIIQWTFNDTAVSFKEIKPGTYTFKEVKAPAGYTLETSTWTVQIEYKGALPVIKKGEVTVKTIKNDGIYSYTCYNTPAYELPSTGGNGIFWYMMSGMSLMMAAAFIVYKNKCREVLRDR